MKNKTNGLSQKTKTIKNNEENDIIEVNNLETLTIGIMYEYFYNNENSIYHQDILNKNDDSKYIKRFYIPEEIYIGRDQKIKFVEPKLEINSKNYEYFDIVVKKKDENDLTNIYMKAMEKFLNDYACNLAIRFAAIKLNKH